LAVAARITQTTPADATTPPAHTPPPRPADTSPPPRQADERPGPRSCTPPSGWHRAPGTASSAPRSLDRRHRRHRPIRARQPRHADRLPRSRGANGRASNRPLPRLDEPPCSRPGHRSLGNRPIRTRREMDPDAGQHSRHHGQDQAGSSGLSMPPFGLGPVPDRQGRRSFAACRPPRTAISSSTGRICSDSARSRNFPARSFAAHDTVLTNTPNGQPQENQDQITRATTKLTPRQPITRQQQSRRCRRWSC
jgi:hypothetical protein